MIKKKYFVLIIIALLSAFFTTCLAYLPSDEVFAGVKEGVAISLSSPQSITARGNNLYIADTIEEGGQKYTIIHVLTPDGIKSLFADKSLKGETTDIAVTPNQSVLFLMQQDKIISYDLTKTDPSIKTINVNNVLDIEACNDALYFAYYTTNNENKFYYVGARLADNFDVEVKASNFYGSQIKYLINDPADDQRVIVYFNMNDTLYSSKLSLNSTKDKTETHDENAEVFKDVSEISDVINVFQYGTEILFYSPKTIKNILFAQETTDLQLWQNCGFLAKDIAIAGDTMFVLCDYTTKTVGETQNKYYEKPRLIYTTVDVTTETKPALIEFYGELGASELNYNLPDYDISKIQVATAIGYPSNIIYKPTNTEFIQDEKLNAIERDKFDATDRFIILAQSDDQLFSYVFFQGKFGWIRNSNCIKTDSKATGLDLDGIILIKSNVYHLPIESDDFLLSDSLEKLSSITVIGEYENFYLIKYSLNGAEQYGFVFAVNIGSNSPKKDHTPYQRKAANPVVGKRLEIYLTAETDAVEDNYLLDANGNQITVKGGKEVRLYETLDNGVCYVGVVVDDILYKGYVASTDLLKAYNIGMTNSQILATACTAIVLVVIIYIVILRLRTKKMEAVREEANAKLNFKKLQEKDPNIDEDFFDVNKQK